MTVASTTDEIQKMAADGAKRLLARASDNRSLKPEQLSPRIVSAIQKYLLRDEPSTPLKEINAFIDGYRLTIFA
jgi:hypothetical protein